MKCLDSIKNSYYELKMGKERKKDPFRFTGSAGLVDICPEGNENDDL